MYTELVPTPSGRHRYFTQFSTYFVSLFSGRSWWYNASGRLSQYFNSENHGILSVKNSWELFEKLLFRPFVQFVVLQWLAAAVEHYGEVMLKKWSCVDSHSKMSGIISSHVSSQYIFELNLSLSLDFLWYIQFWNTS